MNGAQSSLFDALIVDNFAGGGGASTGIELALGRPVSIAINHDPAAILMHKANHPYTRHYCESVWKVDPRELCGGQEVALAWFSPDCKHFSKAKGAALVDRNICGNAVYPPFARALAAANLPEYAAQGIDSMREPGRRISA